MTLCTTHIQAWSAQQLQQDLGFASDQARQLSEWSHGVDASPVAERPPPKTLSIQMTLTPIPLVMHPSMGRDIAVAGGKAGEPRHVLPTAVKLHKFSFQTVSESCFNPEQYKSNLPGFSSLACSMHGQPHQPLNMSDTHMVNCCIF